MPQVRDGNGSSSQRATMPDPGSRSTEPLLTVLGGEPGPVRRSLVDPAEAAADRTARAEVFGLTDRGKRRENNEDQFLVAELERSMLLQQSSFPPGDGSTLTGSPQGRLLMVADGVGGRGNGEVASAVAVDAMAHYALAVMPWMLTAGAASEQELRGGIERALSESQERMKRVAQRHGFDARMSTTLTMAYITWPYLYVAHAGDSRCYVMQRGQLARLTHDHTLAAQMVDSKMVTEEQAATLPWRSVLTNAVGGSSQQLVVEFHRVELAADDVVLLCTDGLTTHVDDARITAHLRPLKRGGVEAAAHALVQAALDGGGTDNVTLVLARF